MFVRYQHDEDSIPADLRGQMPIITPLEDGLAHRLIYIPDEYDSDSDCSNFGFDEEVCEDALIM
ncbi:MAG: hypothetical protein V2I33_24580 [Kangiellaceae bacterium]|nr:hypothetical protein [Kangiellaceae bacterium]